MTAVLPRPRAAGCSNSVATHVRSCADEHEPIIPERFKTKMCRNFELKGKCPYDHRCKFAHGEHELRTEELNIAEGLTTEAALSLRLKQEGNKAKKAARALAAASSKSPKDDEDDPEAPRSVVATEVAAPVARQSGARPPLPRSQKRNTLPHPRSGVPAPRSATMSCESAAAMAGFYDASGSDQFATPHQDDSSDEVPSTYGMAAPMTTGLMGNVDALGNAPTTDFFSTYSYQPYSPAGMNLHAMMPANNSSFASTSAATTTTTTLLASTAASAATSGRCSKCGKRRVAQQDESGKPASKKNVDHLAPQKAEWVKRLYTAPPTCSCEDGLETATDDTTAQSFFVG